MVHAVGKWSKMGWCEATSCVVLKCLIPLIQQQFANTNNAVFIKKTLF